MSFAQDSIAQIHTLKLQLCGQPCAAIAVAAVICAVKNPPDIVPRFKCVLRVLLLLPLLEL
jgi:hypothetical protein